MKKTYIGIITFNNLPVLKKCIGSWLAYQDMVQLHVWDNGSNDETIKFLGGMLPLVCLFSGSVKNHGCCYPRNRMIEMAIMRGYEYFMTLDSDVELYPGCVEKLEKMLDEDQSVGIAGYRQAVHGFPISNEGYVEEISNECSLTRLRMWQEIGLFPESLFYYSGDSCKSTMANMFGWKTKVDGEIVYNHYAHGSQTNEGISSIAESDVNTWTRIENNFVKYWQTRFLVGKGNHHLSDIATEIEPIGAGGVVVIKYPEEANRFHIIKPENAYYSTQSHEIKALLWLVSKTDGLMVEIGCHTGMTSMQLAYNFPDRQIIGVDYCGDKEIMVEQQKREKLQPDQVAIWSKPFKNFNFLSIRTEDWVSNSIGAGFVFIDADHSYEGVKRDSEIAVRLVKKGIIAWHDYIHDPKHDHAWIGVRRYLTEISDRFPIQTMCNTNIAFTVVS